MADLRLGTFNLLSGRSLARGATPAQRLDDGAARAEPLAAAVAGLDVDVLAVQEVDRCQPRSGGVDQLDVVARALGARAGRFAATLHGVPGPGRGWRVATGDGEPWVGADSGSAAGSVECSGPSSGTGSDTWPGAGSGAAYGIGLVSRLPVLAWRVRRFAAARGVLPLAVPGPGRVPRLLLVPEEPRVALAAVVATPAGPVTVISTHLSFVPFAAVRQLWTITRWARSLPAPRLLCGDLNLPGPVPALVTGWSRLGVATTFPSPGPRLQLDHLLGDRWPGQVVRVATPALAVSDHRPLVVQLAR